MVGHLLLVRRKNRRSKLSQVKGWQAGVPGNCDISIHYQAVLAAGQVDVNVCQKLRIEQGTMERATRIINFKPVSQGV